MNTPKAFTPLLTLSSDLTSAIGQFRAQFHLSLSTKVALIVAGISLLGVLVSAFLLENRQRQNIVSSAEQTASHLYAPIVRSLSQAEVDHDFPAFQARLEQAATDVGADRIRILNPKGQIAGSSVSSDLGLKLTLTDVECESCHARTPSNPPASALVTRAGKPMLQTVSPISNQPQCQGCHGADPKVLGLLMIDMPLDILDTQLRESYIEIAESALLTFVLLVGLMVPLLRRYLMKPIQEFSQGIAEIGVQNLDYRIQVKGDDELAMLAEGLEKMRQQLMTSRREMERQNRELALLNDVALAANEYLELDQVLNVALDTVMNRLRMETGHIFLYNQSTSQFDSVASRGLSQEQLDEIELRRKTASTDFVKEVVESNQVVYWPDISANPTLKGLFTVDVHRSLVSVPLRAKQSIVGTLAATTPPDIKLSYRELATLEAVGHEIGTAIENALLLERTRHDQQVATVLYQLGTEISASLVLSDVLTALANSARSVLRVDIGAVGLLHESGQEVRLEAVSGLGTQAPGEFVISLRPGTWGRALVENRAVAVQVAEMDPRHYDTKFLSRIGIHSLLAVPLWQGGKLCGTLCAMTAETRDFGENDLQLMGHLAHRGAVAVENARLHNQVRDLATLEERDRLAREIHDNLAQALVYLNLRTCITRDALAAGQVGEAQRGVDEIQELVKKAYTDTREAIFNLRATSSLGSGLIPALRDYLSEYSSHYGVNARLMVEGEANLLVPTNIGIEILRIIQEAVTNIRKHSRSHTARISLARADHHLLMQIEDEGAGFDTAAVMRPDSEHVGLQIMRERAESMGGRFEIHSQPGKGTRIRVELPIE
ncbi:MAG: GAF domain-containing protein [Rudaea sp.]